jgi:hypothetical protein
MSCRPHSLMSALVALSAIVSAVGTPDRASAGFIVTVTEVGSDLLFEYSGGFTGLATRSAIDTDPSQWGYGQNVFIAQNNVGGENPTRGGQSRFSGTFSGGPASFFPGALATPFITTTSASPGAGTLFFNKASESAGFATALSFVSGDYSTSGSFTIPSKSYADLGLPQNSSNSWNYTQTGQSFVPGNTLTIVTVPEPSALAIAAVGGAIAIASRVIRRRRVAAD